MRDQNKTYFVGIDIGSVVRCIVGVFEDEPSPTIIGYGSSVNNGMRKGVISHHEDVVNAVTQAVNEAERVSGVPIKSATVNIAGSHIEGTDSKGVVAISSSNKIITSEDKYRVEEAATIIQMPSNRQIIQVFAKNYSLDGQGGIKDPVGMEGVRLEVDTHIVTVGSQSIKLLQDVLETTSIQANHITTSSLALAEVVLTRKQKESGSVVIDIGAGTTSIVVFEDGEVQYVAELPVGGLNITNDLAIGLRTDLDVAEVVKIQFGNLKEEGKRSRDVFIKESGISHKFDMAEVNMIISARLEEILELVDKELQKIKKSRKLPGGVVLTGGSAQIPGIVEFTKNVLELPVKVGKAQELGGVGEAVNDGSFDTAIGLMMLDMLLGSHQEASDKDQSMQFILRAKQSLGKILRKR